MKSFRSAYVWYSRSFDTFRVTEDDLKTAVEKEIGVGKVVKLKSKKFIKNLQTRNVLMSFVDADALKVRYLTNRKSFLIIEMFYFVLNAVSVAGSNP